MKQEQIKEVLDEAAHPNCTWQRRNEIQCLLADGVRESRNKDFPDTVSISKAAEYQLDTNTKVEAFMLIMSTLYVDLCQKRPQDLPLFFPVFAMLCGDRDAKYLIADIEWIRFLYSTPIAAEGL